ncbi:MULTISPECIES: hypothetical protein [Bradyrhizobium]|uniref:Uncharacterized protein n=1 Tax=Bradyrhizobium nanningense TaxID=1325118 RepID=A0A4Q0RZ41_9BRAD|nr:MULTISPECIES: hypothetical protein [Bradyrhizobium]RXH21292.1 hypothetical protein XH84_37200 [Bradyrhizobium nanningense]RXH25665.1 hypothetical protein XH99_23945 [Bradyrhizobium nanningense]TQF32572.1 hypothetical protein UNPA324_25520 [Bradyrhizobium sp. UNPA324]
MEDGMEIVGRAPELTGLLWDAFICEGFAHNGQLVANANVVHACFAGVWHKLVYDCGVIIWRPSENQPHPWSVASEGWECPHVDVGAIAGVVGHRLDDYRMVTTATGSQVVFLFDDGRTITINNENDLSAFQID